MLTALWWLRCCSVSQDEEPKSLVNTKPRAAPLLKKKSHCPSPLEYDLCHPVQGALCFGEWFFTRLLPLHVHLKERARLLCLPGVAPRGVSVLFSSCGEMCLSCKCHYLWVFPSR